MSSNSCKFPSCERPVRRVGLCNGHSQQHYKGNGLSPLRDSRVATYESFEQFVEITPHCWNWVGTTNWAGYGRVTVNGTTAMAHRVSYEKFVGKIPSGMFIDHTCHNTGCVNPDHLRVVTCKQNNEHQSGPQSNSRSGVLGVTWHKASGKWRAQVKHNHRVIHVGLFEDIADADAAVRAKRNELFTHNDKDRSGQRLPLPRKEKH